MMLRNRPPRHCRRSRAARGAGRIRRHNDLAACGRIARAEGWGLETAVLAGGCFWGVQAVYQHVKGVNNAVSGYAGGTQKDAALRNRRFRPDRPCGIGQGHLRPVADVIRQDPESYLLGRARPDPAQSTGPGRRPALSLGDFPAERRHRLKTAKAYIAQLDATKVFKRPIVTKTGTMKATFFLLEAYHQDDAIRYPFQPYIAINDAPKVENLKKMFPGLSRDQPVLVSQAAKTN